MRGRFKFLTLFICAAMAVCSLAGCNRNSTSVEHTGSGTKEDPYILRFSAEDAEGIASTEGCHWIADEVKKRTDGKVILKVYPSASLGDADLEYQGLMDGSIDMCMFYFSSTYSKVFDIAAIPFLTSDYDQIAYMVSDKSNMYKLYKEKCEDIGIKFISFYMNGVNGMFATKPFGDYMDINKKKKLLIRIANSKTYSLGIDALGYNVITIPWSDTYTSLQTGVMDGMTGIPSYMVYQNFRDLAKYYVPTNEFMESKCILMAPETARWIGEDNVAIIQEVCDEACADSVEQTESNVKEGEKDLAAAGCEIEEMTDEQRAELADKVLEKIQPDLQKYFGQEMMDLINEDITNARAYSDSRK